MFLASSRFIYQSSLDLFILMKLLRRCHDGSFCFALLWRHTSRFAFQADEFVAVLTF